MGSREGGYDQAKSIGSASSGLPAAFRFHNRLRATMRMIYSDNSEGCAS